MIKFFLISIFSFTVTLCAAQKQLLTYQDLQAIIQNPPVAATTILQQKDYHLHQSASNETRYLAIYADNDYSDVILKANGKHQTLTVLTTHLEQVELIQKALQDYPFKNSKGVKIYRIKDAAVSKIAFSENEPQKNFNKVFTIELEI